MALRNELPSSGTQSERKVSKRQERKPLLIPARTLSHAESSIQNYTTPLMPFPEYEHEVKIQLAEAEALKETTRLLNELHDQSTPWEGWKTWLSGIVSLYSGGSTASTVDFFANRLVNGDRIKNALDESARSSLRYATTPAAAVPTFLLSFNSNFSSWNRFLRAAPYLTRDDYKRNALPLILTSLSALVSMKAGLDAWQGINPWLQYTLAAGRGLSAMSVNGLFAARLWKNIRGVKASPYIGLISGAHQNLKTLARNDPDAFIQALSDSKLFERLFKINQRNTQQSKQHVNEILESLLAIYQEEKIEVKAHSYAPKIKIGVSYALASMAALPYFKTGQGIVPDLFGLSSPVALWALGSAFGLSSAAVNAAICAINTADAINKFASKECSLGECCTLFLKLYFLLGYSLANFGMGLQYPSPVKDEVLGWVEGSVNFLVYSAIGDMSFDNFFTKMGNGYYVHWQKILDNAKKAHENGTDLNTFYQSLDEKDKPILVRILNEYLTWSFESLTDFFNYSSDDIVNMIVTKENQIRITNTFPTQPDDAAEPVTIHVEPPAAASPMQPSSRTTSQHKAGLFAGATRTISKAAQAVFSEHALDPPTEFTRSTSGVQGLRHRTPSKATAV